MNGERPKLPASRVYLSRIINDPNKTPPSISQHTSIVCINNVTNSNHLKGWLYYNTDFSDTRSSIHSKLRLRWFDYSPSNNQLEFFLNPKDLSRLGGISLDNVTLRLSNQRDEHCFYHLDIIYESRVHRLYHENWDIISAWHVGLEKRSKKQHIAPSKSPDYSSETAMLMSQKPKPPKAPSVKNVDTSTWFYKWSEAANPLTRFVNSKDDADNNDKEPQPVSKNSESPLIQLFFNSPMGQSSNTTFDSSANIAPSTGLMSKDALKTIPDLSSEMPRDKLYNGTSIRSSITTIGDLESIGMRSTFAIKDCQGCEKYRGQYWDIYERLQEMEKLLVIYKQLMEDPQGNSIKPIDLEYLEKMKDEIGKSIFDLDTQTLTPGGADAGSVASPGIQNQMVRLIRERESAMQQNAILQAEVLSLRHQWATSVQHEHYLLVGLERMSELYRKQQEYMTSLSQGFEFDTQEKLNLLNQQIDFEDIYNKSVKTSDEYGFFLSCDLVERINCFRDLQDVSNILDYLTETDLTKFENMQLNKWSVHIKDWDVGQLEKVQDFKVLLRNGVPKVYRGKVWEKLTMFYVEQYRSQHDSNYYFQTLERLSGKQTVESKQIELDLERSLPENVYFESPQRRNDPGNVKQGIFLPSLRNVLMAFADAHVDTVGYCQGLDRLAAVLLLNLPEELAFWSLTVIVRRLRPPEYYTPSLKDAQADQRVFKELVYEQVPRVARKLDEFDVDITLFSFRWFLTIFVDGFSWKIYMKIWDAFLYEGDKIIFRYAVAVVVYLENILMNQSDASGIMRVLKYAGQLVRDHHRLSHIAFHDLKQFPKRRISVRRNIYRDLIQTEIEDRKRQRDEHSLVDRVLPAYKKLSPTNSNNSDDE